jgi:chitodextrinase
VWVQGKLYAAGSVVSYSGKLYRAKYANPGYVPTISTYYWAPVTSSVAAWVQSQNYAVGAIVSDGGKQYQAKLANMGFKPSVSTSYWAAYSC